MSYYAVGCSSYQALGNPLTRTGFYQQARPVTQVGAWVATPGWLKEQINKLVAEWSAMGKEVTIAMGQDGATEKMHRFREEVWTPMSARFYEFANGHQKWYQNMWGNTWDTTKEWRQTLIRLREQAEAAGFDFQAPKPLPPERHLWDKVETLLKWIAAALVGVGVVWAIRLLVETFRGSRG